jgi:DNA polymerase III subunit delta
MRVSNRQEADLLYILWGEDQFSLEETLQQIKNQLGDPSFLITNTNLLEGPKLTTNELKLIGEAVPFLAEKRLVIVKGLLSRFEAKDRAGKPKKSAEGSGKKDDSQLFTECILGLPQSTVLVLIDILEMKKNVLQNNPLYKGIAEKADIKMFPTLRGVKLSQWIQSRAAQQNASISRQATNILMELIGGDLHAMTNEISKLAAYTGSRQIEEKDVRLVVAAAQEADIFAMVDFIMDRQSGPAEQILLKLLQNGTAPAQILALIARQIQMLIQIKELKSQKRPSAEIQSRLGIGFGFIWDKVSGRAEKYTPERLKDIYLSLLETDLSIKTGRFEGDLALNVLVASLCDTK